MSGQFTVERSKKRYFVEDFIEVCPNARTAKPEGSFFVTRICRPNCRFCKGEVDVMVTRTFVACKPPKGRRSWVR